MEKNRDSSVIIVTSLRTERPGFDSGQAFAFVIASRPTLEPIQPPKGDVSVGINSRGVKMTDHLHLVPSLRNRGVIRPLAYTSSWRGT
jgi:hypothetical protein